MTGHPFVRVRICVTCHGTPAAVRCRQSRRPGRVLRCCSWRTRSRATADSGPESSEPDHHRIQHPQPGQEGPPKALSLIQRVLALTEDGLHIPAPAVVDWTEAIDAHIAQSEGRSREKQSYVFDTFSDDGEARQPP